MTSRPEGRDGDPTPDRAREGEAAGRGPVEGKKRDPVEQKTTGDEPTEDEKARTEIAAGDVADDLADFA